MGRFADADAAFALDHGTDARGAVGDLPVLEEDERSLAVSGRWPLDVVGVRIARDAVRARVGVASFGDGLYGKSRRNVGTPKDLYFLYKSVV